MNAENKMADFKKNWPVMAAVIICMIATAAVHRQGLDAPFHFDDQIDIVDRIEIRGGVVEAMWSSPYRAVTYMTYALDWKAGKGTPRRFHFTNLFIHTVATGLLFLILMSLIRTGDLFSRISASAAGTLFFSLHPLMASNVTYITGRAGLLAGLFSMIVVLLYISRPFRGWQAAALIAFIPAMFSKEDAASLPILLLAISMLGDRDKRALSRVLEAVPFFAMAGVYGIFRIFTHKVDLGATAGPSLAEHIMLGPYVWIKSLAMMFWPVGLTADHHVPAITGISDLRLIIPLIALLLIAATAAALWRTGRTEALSPVWFAVALLPATVMPLADPFAQNRLYFAFAGVALLTGLAAAALLNGRSGKGGKFGVIICFIIIAAMLASLSIREQGIWTSRLKLWANAVRMAPESARPWDNLGLQKFRARDFTGAKFALRRSLIIDPENGVAWNTLGLVYKDMGSYPDALIAYDRSIAINPGLPKVRANRASVLLALGRVTEAEEGYREALALDASDTDAHYGLAYVLFITRRFDEAKGHLEELLRIDPGDSMASDFLRKLP